MTAIRLVDHIKAIDAPLANVILIVDGKRYEVINVEHSVIENKKDVSTIYLVGERE